MKHLNHSDRINLNAAEGWFDLGDLESASNELEEISPEFRADPVVLIMRYQIYHAAKRWDAVIAIANTLIQKLPTIANGWIYGSYALHELKRTQEAYDFLLPAVEKFPKLWVVPYNLACYACQLGKMEEAMNRLEQAINLGRKDNDIRLDALKDPDLEPLWVKIGKI